MYREGAEEAEEMTIEGGGGAAAAAAGGGWEGVGVGGACGSSATETARAALVEAMMELAASRYL